MLGTEVMGKAMYYLSALDEDVAKYYQKQGVSTKNGITEFRQLMDRIEK